MKVNKLFFNFVLSMIVAMAFVVVLPNPGNSVRIYDVLLSDVSATCNPNFCNVSIAANGTLISMSFHAIERLDNVFIHLEAGGKREYGQYHNLFNQTLVLCEIIHDRKRYPFSGKIYDGILKNKENHLFSSCPLKAVSSHSFFRSLFYTSVTALSDIFAERALLFSQCGF